MKIYKKLVGVLVFGMAATGSISNVGATEVHESKMSHIAQEFKNFSDNLYSTTTPDTIAPIVKSVRTATIDSKTCMLIQVEDSESPIQTVMIDSKTATVKSTSNDRRSGEYYIEITTAGNHTVYLKDSIGNERSVTEYVSINDSKKPILELSQIYKDGNFYIEIYIEDNSSIASLTVNDSAISFDAKGGTLQYKVTKTQTYTVAVTDIAGNKTTEKIDVDIEAGKPTLTVEKKLKDGLWYLAIKAYPDGGTTISKVTVNNARITFNRVGEAKDYPISSTGNYVVTVTDNFNQQVSQTVYVDVNLNSDSNKPSLSVTQKDVGGVTCLSITAKPSSNIANNTMSQVTVNGTGVAMPTTGGTAEYTVPVAGNYTVVATDVNGNTTSQTVYVAMPTVQQQATTQNTANIGGSSSVVFTLNKTSWTKNRVSQTMDAAPLIKDGRIYIPIRYVAYALNIDSGKVTWDAKSKSAIIYDGNNVIKVPLGSKTMTVNGTNQAMEAAAFSKNGRVYIPISQVAKAFSGVNMQWDNTQKQITIIRK